MADPDPLRVLLLLDSLVGGGAERSTVALLPSLRSLGVIPTVGMLLDRPGLQDDVAAAGVEVVDLSGPGGRRGATQRIRTELLGGSYDLVHTALFEADVCGRTAARLAKVPAVSTLTTTRYSSDHWNDPKVSRAGLAFGWVLDATTARTTRRLHAVSDHVRSVMAARLRYPLDRIDVVHRGRPDAAQTVDRRAASQRVRRELELGDRPMVLALARQDRVKGLDRLLSAFDLAASDLPDAELVIAGREGNQSEELRRLVAGMDNGDRVRFLGHRADPEELLAAADLFVLPSRREGSPGSLLEAMSLQTATLAHDMPQVHEVVSNAMSWIVDCADTRLFATALTEAVDRPSERTRRASEARRQYETGFTIEQSARGIDRFYRAALGST